MRRNEFLDFTKGVLIVLVSVGHAIQYVMYHNQDFWEDPLFKTIYIFHMPLFMAVSGYLSFRGITQAKSLLKYVSQRLIFYLLPIIVWAMLFQTVVFLTTKYNSLTDLPVAIIFEAIWSLWFIWALIGCLICTAIAQSAGQLRWLVFLLLFGLVLALPSQWNIYLFQYTFPFFVAGFYGATLKPSLLQAIGRSPLIFKLLALASGLCFVVWNKNTYVYVSGMSLSGENLPNILLRWIAGILVSSFAMLVLFHVNAVMPKIVRRRLILFGRDSMYVYILQSYAFLALLSWSERYFKFVPNLVWRDLSAIILGIMVVYGCWWLGQALSRDKIMALLLFGKARPPEKLRIRGGFHA